MIDKVFVKVDKGEAGTTWTLLQATPTPTQTGHMNLQIRQLELCVVNEACEILIHNTWRQKRKTLQRFH